LYAAWLTFGDSFKDIYFPDQQNWNSKIVLRQEETGWNYDVYISVRALDGKTYIAPNTPLTWRDNGRREHEVKGDSLYTMRDSGSGRELSVIIKQCERSWLAFNKYRIPNKPIIIGRSDKAAIRDTGVLMTAEHGYLGVASDGFVKYQDRSSNGTYLNARKLHGNATRLKFGDVLAFPTGLKIVYLGDCIAVNRTVGSSITMLDKWNQPGEAVRTNDDGREVPSVYMEYPRAPRMLKKCEAENVDIEAPIPKQKSGQQPLFLQIGPSMTMILPMLMGSVLAGNGRGLLSSGLVMISTSSMLAIMWGLINRKYRKNQENMVEERRVNMYRQYIQETENELREMNEREYNRLLDTFPNTAQCANMPVERSRYLWNRMPTHPDFLHVRIGTGNVEMPCEISVPKQKLSVIDDELREEPNRLKVSYSTIEGAPVTLPFRNEPVVGILGRMQAVLFAQGLLMQIAALHSYHDVRIAVLTDESCASQWSWVRWLPHIFTSEDRELRMFAYTTSDVHDVVSHLDETLTIRKNNAEEDNDDNGEDATPLPHYVIFCTNHSILENEPIMRQLLTNHLGMTLVVIGSEMTHLPKECRVVLNMQSGEGMLHTSEGDTRKIDFEYPDRGLLKGFSRSMAPLRVRDVAQNAAIPTLVSFLDIYNVRRVEDLEVWRMWNENQTYEGLRSIIGYRAGSQPFVLDISDKYHGPHGLIAGTTGSGKSVMLETYILSLALNYSPKQVQFILIDYKGGGMADSFKDLPHVAGVIDNLQGPRIIDRALASLNGEIHRREKIFKAVKINNINDYTRQYGDEPGMEMPHLVIIVDEFAELKSEQPEFMGELVSASRVGRSLGIHLILATQKPSNSVSDEIWANSRFHLCLRVQTRQDSMEMLKRPDAAYIKGMGRCFIQIGNDELFEQVQTSYSGLDYKPDEPRAEEMPQLLTTTGHVVRVKKPKKPVKIPVDGAEKNDKEEKEETQMTAVLGQIMKVAAEHKMDHNRQMWLPELPGHIYMRDLEIFGQAAWDGTNYPNPIGDVVMLVGVADDVANQRYLPFTYDLTEHHNLIIAGLAGTGKTTLIQSIVYSLCSMYDPEHISIYILSLTSQTLGCLSYFPQVADIAFEDEVTEIKRLINMMYSELVRRAEMFAEAATDNFVEFNNSRIKRGDKPEPVIVVFVDRYAQLMEIFQNDDFYKGRINQLIQDGSGRGIHLVVTAMMKNEIPGKMHPFFGGLALQLKDRSDYGECIGKKIPYDMPPIGTNSGRGMGVQNDTVYEVQFALGGGAPLHKPAGFSGLSDIERFAITHKIEDDEKVRLTDVDRAEQIIAYAKDMDRKWIGSRPMPIPRIPQDPTWETMFGTHGYGTTRNAYSSIIPVGYDMVQGGIATINTEEAPAWAVYGPKRSGVSNFLKLMARVMIDRGSDVLIIADSGWKNIATELGIKLYSTVDDVREFLETFIDKYSAVRKPLHDAAVANGRAAARRQAAAFKHCSIIIDNSERLYEDFSKTENNNKEKFVRGMNPLELLQSILGDMSGDIAEKMYYNYSIFVGLSAKNRMMHMQEPYKRIIAQCRAIALGGRLGEFDPCGVGGSFNSKVRGAAMPLGQGFIGINGDATQIVVPLAEEEEE